MGKNQTQKKKDTKKSGEYTTMKPRTEQFKAHH